MNILKEKIGSKADLLLKTHKIKLNNVHYIVPSHCDVYSTNCEYCNKLIYAIWDQHNKNNWWPYPGNSAKNINSFKYSEIIQEIKKLDGCLDKTWINCPLLNINARCHSEPTNEIIRFSEESVKFLCNNCFRETFNRVKILGYDGITYSLSVVKSRGETIETVMNNLGIQGEILGKGSISDYS